MRDLLEPQATIGTVGCKPLFGREVEMGYDDCSSSLALWVLLVVVFVILPLLTYTAEYDGLDNLWDKWRKKSRKKSRKKAQRPSLANYPSPASFLERRGGMPQETQQQDGVFVVVGQSRKGRQRVRPYLEAQHITCRYNIGRNAPVAQAEPDENNTKKAKKGIDDNRYGVTRYSHLVPGDVSCN